MNTDIAIVISTPSVGIRQIDERDTQLRLVEMSRDAAQRHVTAFDFPGVYLLIGEYYMDFRGNIVRKVYIGEGDTVANRIRDHLKWRTFWSTVILIKREKYPLHKTLIQDLECRLYNVFKEDPQHWECENGTPPTRPTMDSKLCEDSDRLGDSTLDCLKLLGVLHQTKQIVSLASNLTSSSPRIAGVFANGPREYKRNNKPRGDQAIEYTRAFLRNQECLGAFQKLIEVIKKGGTETEFRWRNDRHLNVLKTNGRPSTAIMIRPQGAYFDIHLYFEEQTPAAHDDRLRNSTSDNTGGKRAKMLRVSMSEDIDETLESHLRQVCSFR